MISLSPNITKTIESLCDAQGKTSMQGETYVVPNSYIELVHLDPAALSAGVGFTPKQSLLYEFFILHHNGKDIPFYGISFPIEKESVSLTKDLAFETVYGTGIHALTTIVYASHPELGSYPDSWTQEFNSIFPNDVNNAYIRLQKHIQSLGFSGEKSLAKMCGIVDLANIDVGIAFGIDVITHTERLNKLIKNPYYGPSLIYINKLLRFLPGLADQLNALAHSSIRTQAIDTTIDYVVEGSKKLAMILSYL